MFLCETFSYKYHARALVTNERNLVRVFDVAFDGYTGGNDSKVLEWTENSTKQFADATANLNQSYNGPSMIVFSLPQHNAIFQSFPRSTCHGQAVFDAQCVNFCE